MKHCEAIYQDLNFSPYLHFPSQYHMFPTTVSARVGTPNLKTYFFRLLLYYQGYFNVCCCKAGQCCEQSCPEFCLFTESCLCNSLAVSATRSMVMDQYQLQMVSKQNLKLGTKMRGWLTTPIIWLNEGACEFLEWDNWQAESINHLTALTLAYKSMLLVECDGMMQNHIGQGMEAHEIIISAI